MPCRVPAHVGPARRGGDDRTQRGLRYDRILPPVLQQDRPRPSARDPANRIDCVQRTPDLRPKGSRRLRDVGGNQRGAGRDQHEVADSRLDAGEDGADLASVAPADEPDSARVHVWTATQEVDRTTNRDDVGDELPPVARECLHRCQLLGTGRRLAGGQRERQADRAPAGQPDRGGEELKPISAGTVQVDDRGQPPVPWRNRQIALHASARRRVGDLADGDRIGTVGTSLVPEGERLRRVVGERRGADRRDRPRRRRRRGGRGGRGAHGTLPSTAPAAGEQQRRAGYRSRATE